MFEELEKIIIEIGNLSNNDGYDEELDELVQKLYDIILNMSVLEIKELFKKKYMIPYKEMLKEYLIKNNRWEEEYYGS